jgi:hypothetical protein
MIFKRSINTPTIITSVVHEIQRMQGLMAIADRRDFIGGRGSRLFFAAVRRC